MDEEWRGNNSTTKNRNADMVIDVERGNCRNPSTCDFLRNRNAQPSTEVLYMMPNFDATPSEQEKFYDCVSESDYPYEGSYHSSKPNERFDDPEAFRIALQRAADAAQMLLRDLDNKPSNQVTCPAKQRVTPCGANLEFTSKLTNLSGSQENDICCDPFRLRIEPITFKIPIKVDLMGVTAGVREPIASATVHESHYSGFQTDSDKHIEHLNYPDEEHPNDQRSQTDSSYLKDQRSKNLPILKSQHDSDDALEPNVKKSQTDTSFLKDKAIREGKIQPEEQEKRTNIRMDDSSENEKPKSKDALSTDAQSTDDPNEKPSQTDTSFLRDKQMKSASGIDKEEQVDPEARGSLGIPDRMKYPTNFRTNDEGELDDVKVSHEVICKCSNTNELKIDNKVKVVSSDDEVGEVGCKCKTEKSGFDDGIEDLCSPGVIKETCDGRRRSDEEEERLFESKHRQQQKPHVHGEMPCCSTGDPCRRDSYDSTELRQGDIYIVSQKDIKNRGGFKPKHVDDKSKSWFTYGERPTYLSSTNQGPSGPSGPSGQSGQSGHNVQYGYKYGATYSDDDGEDFKSCESESDTDVICRCTAEHSCRKDKSMPCICRSEVSHYKFPCSGTCKKSDKKKPTSDGDSCKKTPQSEASNTSVSPCSVCGLPQSPSKQNASCVDQSASQQTHPPCEECDAKPTCSSNQPADDDKLNSCYCSTHSLTCRDDPDAPCNTIALRKEKIMRHINNLIDVSNCTGAFADDRPVIIEQLFKELTYLLGRDMVTTDNDEEKNLDCCLFKMKEYLEECFLKDLPPPKKKKRSGKIELYNVERDPDFVYSTSKAVKRTAETDDECGGHEDHSDCGGKGGGTGGDEDGDSDGDAEGVQVNVINIGGDTAGECADCESATDTFFGECEEDAQPPCGETEKQPSECGACAETTSAAHDDCNICDDNAPVPSDCDICGEEMRLVRSEGPCSHSEPECQCCHCRALRSEKECRTVTKTVECAMLDPVCELRYFIDSIIFDLETMDHVMHDRNIRTRSVSPKKDNDPCKDTFPVQIRKVHDIGMTSLFVSWEILDCCGIGGYEIYVDGQLSNRLFSAGHQASVLCNVNINTEHKIILRATPLGEEFPPSRTVARRNPDRGPGSCQPWKASVYYYNPC